MRVGVCVCVCVCVREREREREREKKIMQQTKKDCNQHFLFDNEQVNMQMEHNSHDLF